MGDGGGDVSGRGTKIQAENSGFSHQIENPLYILDFTGNNPDTVEL
jgi:hypothetical protein